MISGFVTRPTSGASKGEGGSSDSSGDSEGSEGSDDLYGSDFDDLPLDDIDGDLEEEDLLAMTSAF